MLSVCVSLYCFLHVCTVLHARVRRHGPQSSPAAQRPSHSEYGLQSSAEVMIELRAGLRHDCFWSRAATEESSSLIACAGRTPPRHGKF